MYISEPAKNFQMMCRWLSLFAESQTFFRLEVEGRTYKYFIGEVGKLGRLVRKTFPSEESCEKEADQLLVSKFEEGFAECPFSIPGGFDEHLYSSFEQKHQVRTSFGNYQLLDTENIARDSIIVESLGESLYLEGSYFTPALQLVEAPEKGLPLMFWLPIVKEFAVYHPKAKTLTLLGAEWGPIRNNLDSIFLQATEGRPLYPDCKKCFDFIPASVGDQLDALLRLPSEKRWTEGQIFLASYETVLQRHIFSGQLRTVGRNLLRLYYFLATGALERNQVKVAITILERSLIIASAAFPDHTDILSKIFLHLSSCYFQSTEFDKSVINFERYQVFEPSVQVKNQMISAILNVKDLYNEASNAYLVAIKSKSEAHYISAIIATENALRYLPDNATMLINLACFYAVTKGEDKALLILKKALESGFDDWNRLHHDGHFKALRETDEFTKLVKAYAPEGLA